MVPLSKSGVVVRRPGVQIPPSPPERRILITIMDNTNKPQNGPAGTLSSLIVGLYAWVVAVSFGAVLLDVVYSNLVSEAAAAFSEVADFLLSISAVTVLAALGAM